MYVPAVEQVHVLCDVEWRWWSRWRWLGDVCDADEIDVGDVNDACDVDLDDVVDVQDAREM